MKVVIFREAIMRNVLKIQVLILRFYHEHTFLAYSRCRIWSIRKGEFKEGRKNVI